MTTPNAPLPKNPIGPERAAAVWLYAARLSMTLALIAFALSSYAWWGSPDTLLRPLWKAGVLLLAAWGVATLLYRRAAVRIRLARRAGTRGA